MPDAKVERRIKPHRPASQVITERERVSFQKAIGLVTKKGTPRKLPDCTPELLARREAEERAKAQRKAARKAAQKNPTLPGWTHVNTDHD